MKPIHLMRKMEFLSIDIYTIESINQIGLATRKSRVIASSLCPSCFISRVPGGDWYDLR